MAGSNKIIIKNATENNLKGIDVEIPKNELIVITGVSGSGKSSLAFDIIYKEGQRRYLESFSGFARQYLRKLQRPMVEHISGLSPAIAVDQKTIVRNSRSTVGTLTEISDYLRLLFARLGTTDITGLKLERRLFSFNSSYGACTRCKGLGVIDKIDPELLVSDHSKSLSQGALVITTPTGYIIYSQVTLDVLDQVCNAHGFNIDIPWNELTAEQKDIVLNGSDIIKIPYGKHPLESRLKWSGITAKPREEGYYKGILPVMEEILKRDRNKNILRFARTEICPNCNGSRFNKNALSVKFQNKNIAEFNKLSIGQLYEYFTEINLLGKEKTIAEPVCESIIRQSLLLCKLGLDYLTLDRESTSLSGGEAQRIRLANQASTQLRGVVYVLDEPSVGLHHSDNKKLLEVLKILRDNGNTVIIVEHDEETMLAADHIIDIGPMAGNMGGEILINSPVNELSTADLKKNSKTASYLLKENKIEIPAKRRVSNKFLKVEGACINNLQNIDCEFYIEAFNVVTGVSGAGKSSLVKHTLAKNVKALISKKENRKYDPVLITGHQHFDRIIEIDQAPIGRTPRSNPATYTKLSDQIRDLYASLVESKNRKWNKGRFSFNVIGGRCETCQGAGLLQIGMHFLGNVEVVCHDCNGMRFNGETLEVCYKGKNINDVLEMSVDEAYVFFEGQPKITRFLDVLRSLGLGYISLGQSSTTISGGEAQRIKLATQLVKTTKSGTLYIFDEPTTGLHTDDIRILLEALQRLVNKGNTIIAIEHNIDFIKSADRVLDLGPGSGKNGGRLLFSGTPEGLVLIKESKTAEALKKILSQHIRAELKVVKKKSADRLLPISFKGVSTNNLKNIDVEIPVNEITVITGVSGSGKTSLAFDTIFSEGQQRFTESLSAYARSYLPKTERANFEECSGLMPAIAVNQKSSGSSPRSTVGTLTDIYDYYRLLFSRVGLRFCPICNIPLINNACSHCDFKGELSLTSQMFSFNHEKGACESCKGLGTITICDAEKLITNNEKSLLNGAMDGHKTGRFYGDPYGQYVAMLMAVGEKHSIDYSKSYSDLSDNEKHIAMYGTADQEYDVEWQYKRKNREGSHQMKTRWLGLTAYVSEEYERKHADKRGDAMLRLMTDIKCNKCNGERLKPEFRSVIFAGINISELCNKTVSESIEFFSDIANNSDISSQALEICSHLTSDIVKRLRYLKDVGLGYISIDRKTNSLSGGESQRVRLAGLLGSGLCGITYVLDEPTIGLHQTDTKRLIDVVKHLRDLGNTIIIVEHDREIIESADHIIDMGPGAGENGGKILAQGKIDDIINNKNSITGSYMAGKKLVGHSTREINITESIIIKGARANNLKKLNVEIPCGVIVAVTGVSGSGKTSLINDVLAASAKTGSFVDCSEIIGLEKFSSVIVADSKPIGRTPASCPATFTGIFDKIRDVFAKSEQAANLNLKRAHFSFNNKGGRCESCSGMGFNNISMDFLADVWVECEECKGKRYKDEILNCRVNSMNISDVLEMSVSEALHFFESNPEVHDMLTIVAETGLSYIRLGQPATTLSGGEAQRLKLAHELINKGKGRKLYLFDEPTTGLHFEDIARLQKILDRLIDEGHSIIVVEHNPDLIRNADWIIDLGPDGGDKGGEIIASCAISEFMKTAASLTASVLSD